MLPYRELLFYYHSRGFDLWRLCLCSGNDFGVVEAKFNGYNFVSTGLEFMF